MRSKPANPDELVAGIAARQHGIVTTAQLGKAGLDRAAIRRRVAAGRLHRLHRGVYAVGHTAIAFEGRCLAAVFSCDPDAAGDGRAETRAGDGRAETRAGDGRAETLSVRAALSHRSAAELWGFMQRAIGPVHVTVPADSGRRTREGLIVHRSRTLDPENTAFIAGVRVTTAARTLADLRRGLSQELHQRATRRALDLGLVSRNPSISETALTRSELERAFLRLCRRHRLPQPVVNARVGRYEVDFLWRDQRLVVETDGFRYHGSRDAFERDRARDADLQSRGFRVVRLTHRQLMNDPRKVARSIRGLLGSALLAP